jgi:5'-3' exonuclease
MANIRDLIIDADHILFLVCFSKTYDNGFEDIDSGESYDDFGKTPKLDLTPYKKHFKAIINDYIETAEVESIAYGWTLGKTRVILSDYTNFRYDIYPDYKAKRVEKSDIMKKLKKWALKKYQVEPNTEADDVVAYYVRKGGIGVTTDKDLLYGVEGKWFNAHFKHRSWITTSKKDAEYFFKVQCLAGDPVDEIPALSGVAHATAKKLMKKYGESWNDLLQIYLDRGYTKEYFVTMVRLVCMTQWSPKHGIRLWEFPDEKH